MSTELSQCELVCLGVWQFPRILEIRYTHKRSHVLCEPLALGARVTIYGSGLSARPSSNFRCQILNKSITADYCMDPKSLKLQLLKSARRHAGFQLTNLLHTKAYSGLPALTNRREI